jgi:hypothetical protein
MTLKEDPETKCGYGWFNCNRLLKPFKRVWKWHDGVTSENSAAEQAGIPNSEIVASWKNQIDAEGRKPHMARQGFYKQMGRFSNTVIYWVNRFFYRPR